MDKPEKRLTAATRAVDSRIRVLPVDAILAQTIEEVFREGSVSNLFDGENQLF